MLRKQRWLQARVLWLPVVTTVGRHALPTPRLHPRRCPISVPEVSRMLRSDHPVPLITAALSKVTARLRTPGVWHSPQLVILEACRRRCSRCILDLSRQVVQERTPTLRKCLLSRSHRREEWHHMLGHRRRQVLHKQLLAWVGRTGRTQIRSLHQTAGKTGDQVLADLQAKCPTITTPCSSSSNDCKATGRQIVCRLAVFIRTGQHCCYLWQLVGLYILLQRPLCSESKKFV